MTDKEIKFESGKIALEKCQFIGFELSEDYYLKALKRIKAEKSQLTLDFK